MNKDLNQLKGNFDEYLSTKEVFTEEDKIRIRKRINQTKRTTRRNFSKSFIPNMLTAAVIIFGVFFIGNLVIDERNVSQPNSSMPETTSATVEPKLFTTDETNTDNFGRSLALSESIFLSDELLDIYTAFAETKNEEVLRNLRPLEIFAFYYYAEYHEDYATQYALFIDDEMYLKVYPTLEDFVTAIEEQNREDRLHFIEENVWNGQLQEVINMEEGFAQIFLLAEERLSFGLTLNENGIWKVNWLPHQ